MTSLNTLPSKFRLDGWLDGSIYLVCRISWLSSGYLTLLYPLSGQIAGISSTEFGLANMILAAVSIGKVRSSCVKVIKDTVVNASLLCRSMTTSALLPYVIFHRCLPHQIAKVYDQLGQSRRSLHWTAHGPRIVKLARYALFGKVYQRIRFRKSWNDLW